MDQLALAEALQAKHLAVGGQASLGHLVWLCLEGAINACLEVLGGIDVVLINTDLHKVAGARQAKGIEAPVAGQSAVQPSGPGGVGEPECITLVLPASSKLKSEAIFRETKQPPAGSQFGACTDL